MRKITALFLTFMFCALAFSANAKVCFLPGVLADDGCLTNEEDLDRCAGYTRTQPCLSGCDQSTCVSGSITFYRCTCRNDNIKDLGDKYVCIKPYDPACGCGSKDTICNQDVYPYNGCARYPGTVPSTDSCKSPKDGKIWYKSCNCPEGVYPYDCKKAGLKKPGTSSKCESPLGEIKYSFCLCDDNWSTSPCSTRGDGCTSMVDHVFNGIDTCYNCGEEKCPINTQINLDTFWCSIVPPKTDCTELGYVYAPGKKCVDGTEGLKCPFDDDYIYCVSGVESENCTYKNQTDCEKAYTGFACTANSSGCFMPTACASGYTKDSGRLAESHRYSSVEANGLTCYKPIGCYPGYFHPKPTAENYKNCVAHTDSASYTCYTCTDCGSAGVSKESCEQSYISTAVCAQNSDGCWKYSNCADGFVKVADKLPSHTYSYQGNSYCERPTGCVAGYVAEADRLDTTHLYTEIVSGTVKCYQPNACQSGYQTTNTGSCTEYDSGGFKCYECKSNCQIGDVLYADSSAKSGFDCGPAAEYVSSSTKKPIGVIYYMESGINRGKAVNLKDLTTGYVSGVYSFYPDNPYVQADDVTWWGLSNIVPSYYQQDSDVLQRLKTFSSMNSMPNVTETIARTTNMASYCKPGDVNYSESYSFGTELRFKACTPAAAKMAWEFYPPGIAKNNSGAGQNYWQLPTLGDLALMYGMNENKATAALGQSGATGTVKTKVNETLNALSQKGVGAKALANAKYWTITVPQDSYTSNNWSFDMSNGSRSKGYRGDNNHVRAVLLFQIY